MADRCPLTPTENEVLALVCKGMQVKQVAHQLARSPNTVRSHLFNSYRKLGVTTQAEAVATMFRRGWYEAAPAVPAAPPPKPEPRRFPEEPPLVESHPLLAAYLEAFDRRMLGAPGAEHECEQLVDLIRRRVGRSTRG